MYFLSKTQKKRTICKIKSVNRKKCVNKFQLASFTLVF